MNEIPIPIKTKVVKYRRTKEHSEDTYACKKCHTEKQNKDFPFINEQGLYRRECKKCTSFTASALQKERRRIKKENATIN